MRGTKRGRLPRYIITIALYIYFHDPIFNTFSVSQLDELLLRLTVHGYYFASSPDTLSDFVFLFLFISTRSHMRNRSLLSLLKSTSLIRSQPNFLRDSIESADKNVFKIPI